MTGSRTAAETRSAISRLSHTGLDSFGFRREAALRLGKAVPFDGFWWWTTDPATVFFTSAVLDPVPTVACKRFHDNECLEPDFNKFRVLARRRMPIGILHDATGGRPQQSTRYREILLADGYEHELRAALVSGSACWGALTLLRRSDGPAFSPAEASLIAEIAPHLVDGLRISVLLGALATDDTDEGPGLVMLDGRNGVVGMTPAGRRWLVELSGSGPPGEILPEVVLSVAARSRGIAPDDADAASRTPMARLRTSSGRWLVVHGSPMDPEGGTAVILEPASPSEIAGVIVEAYSLSPREREVARLVVQGLSTKQMAQSMSVSPFTVQDHLKSIFEKVAVRSRGELVARIFAQGYWPWYGEGDRPPRSDGSVDRASVATLSTLTRAIPARSPMP